MATETSSASQSVVVGLAFTAGAGLTLLVIVAGVGAIQADSASPETLGLAFALGIALLVGGIGGWLAVVRPFTHFDDINVPAPDEHHHDSHDHSETALAHAPHNEPVHTA